MQGSALDRIERDHVATVRVADVIQHVLARASTKRDLESVAYDAIDLNEMRLRKHAALEHDTLLAVAVEHQAEDHGPMLRAARDEVDHVQAALNRLRHDVESGEPLRPALEAVELALRHFVNYEQGTLLPWARKTLGARLLREVEDRYAESQAAPVDDSGAALAGAAMDHSRRT